MPVDQLVVDKKVNPAQVTFLDPIGYCDSHFVEGLYERIPLRAIDAFLTDEDFASHYVCVQLLIQVHVLISSLAIW